MKRKMIYSLMIASLLLSGCQKKEKLNINESKNEISQKEENKTYMIKSEFDITDDYFSDANEMFKRNKYVALVEIESIDGASNYSEMAQEYVFPYTYGKMKVLKSYKGDLIENETFDFTRMGGTLTLEEYVKGLNEAERDKMLARTNLKPSDLVTRVFGDDILVEEGKVYLAYIIDDIYCNENAYRLTGLKGGLREVSNLNTFSMDDEIKVLNNYTNEYEPLNTVIPQE